MMRTTAPLILALAVLPACVLYTGEDDDVDPCADYGGGSTDGADIAAAELRNPQTGQCESFYSGGGGGGGDTCGDWGGPPAEDAPAREPAPDWAVCYGPCEGLDEGTCVDTAACRAAYVSDCPQGMDCTDVTYAYYGCFGTAPSGPVQGGTCTGLDAYQCSTRDDCVAQHYPGGVPTGGDGAEAPELVATIGEFEACAPEPGGDGRPGDCYGEVTCDEAPPACPDGTLPGVAAGCYTGFCVPVDECGDTPSCAGLGEAECVKVATCTPLYEGVGCSCDAEGCTCDSWDYAACE